MTPVTLPVPADLAGQRLDRAVVALLPELSRSYVQHLIADDHILVNGRPVRPSYQVQPGDTVTVDRPLPSATDILPEPIPLAVVYEDADVVVVDKPAGLVVHPAPGHPGGTLVNALLARYPDMVVGHDIRPGIVHRLDRDTSGLLVVARHDQALAWLQAQQKRRSMLKLYLAVVEGHFKTPEGMIDAPIARHRTDRQRQAVDPDGRPARTFYRVVEDLGQYTLLELKLDTGRTHQIRVHCAHISRPVLGDPVYGPRKPRASFGLSRQFLHAYRLGFELPAGGWREFTSPLPADLAAALARLRTQV